MPAIDFDRIRDQGKHFVDGFTPGQKAMTILGVIAVVLAGMAFTKWSSTTNYAPLYTNLSGADAGKVTQALDSAGVKWKLADGGAHVLVPSNRGLQGARRAQRRRVCHRSSDGLALLDKEGITASEFVQRVDYQRAMQGELEKTIDAIDGVAVGDREPHDPARPGVRGCDGRHAERGGARAAGGRHEALERRGAGDRPPRRVEHPQPDARRGHRRRLQRQRARTRRAWTLSSTQGLEQQIGVRHVARRRRCRRSSRRALGPNHAAVHVQSDLNFDQQKTTSITNTDAGRHGRQADPAAAVSTQNEKFTGRRRRHQRRARRDARRARRGDGNGDAERTRRPPTQTNNALDQV